MARTTTSRRMRQAKHDIRERVWTVLERQHAVPIPPGAHGRIPNYLRACEAAGQLAALPEWQASQVIKANPDKAQGPVRRRALIAGKSVYMAVPRLAEEHPFVLLDPSRLADRTEDAATSKGGLTLGQPVAVDQVEPIDLVVCGSVAVNPVGARVGKGGGFSDLEVAFLVEAGLLGSNTLLVTTVDDLQVLDEDLPETEHDFRVDVIVTPTRVIRAPRHRRPGGVVWDHLEAAKIAAIPVLARRKPGSGTELPG